MPANKPASTDPLSAGHIDAGATTESHDRMHGRTLKLHENVKAYGAVGDGVTDDTAAITAAFAAAATGGFGYGAGAGNTLHFPMGTYIYNSATPLYLTTFMGIRGAGRWSTTIKFTGAAGFGFTGSVHDMFVKDMTLWSATADVVTYPTAGGVGHFLASNVIFWQDNNAKRIMYGTNTNMVFNRFENCDFGAATGATVSPIQLDGASNINANSWESCLFQANGASAAGVTFCVIDNTNNAGYQYQNNFNNLWGENCIAGMLKMLSTQFCTIKGVVNYDPSGVTTGDMIIIGQHAAGQVSRFNTVEDISNLGTLGGGKYMFNGTGSKYGTIRNVDKNINIGTLPNAVENISSSATITGSPVTFSRNSDYGVFTALPSFIQMPTKAGALIDGDFTGVVDGLMAIDTTNNRIYVRIGGAWKSVVVA